MLARATILSAARVVGNVRRRELGEVSPPRRPYSLFVPTFRRRRLAAEIRQHPGDGLGAGGGLSVSPFGEAAGQASKDYVKGTLGLGCGPVSFGITATLDDCGGTGRLKDLFEVECGVGPFDPCGGSVGGAFDDLDKSLEDLLDDSLKCKLEAKAVAGACAGSKIQ